MSGIFEGHVLLPLFQIQNTWDLKVIHKQYWKQIKVQPHNPIYPIQVKSGIIISHAKIATK